MNITKKQLSQWEDNPLQHKDAIYAADQKLMAEFSESVKQENRYYRIYKPGSPEWMKAAMEDLEQTRLITRVARLSNKAFIAENKMQQPQTEHYLINFPIMGQA